VIALRGVGHWNSYWPFGLVVAVGTATYVAGGRAGGFGALIGGRADERQALIRTRARAWSGCAMVAGVWAAGYNAGEAGYGAAHGADYAPGADM